MVLELFQNHPDRDRSPLPNNPECRTVDDAENWVFDVRIASAPIDSDIDSSPTGRACNNAGMSEPINTAFASVNSGTKLYVPH